MGIGGMKGEIAVTVYYRWNILVIVANEIYSSEVKEKDDSQTCTVDI